MTAFFATNFRAISLGCIVGVVGLLLSFATGPLHSAPLATASPSPAAAFHQPEFFFTIDLDPRYQFVGTGALTEADAATANCYRFIYNSSGKLREIEYRRAGMLMPDPLLGAASIDFEYQPGIERRWFRDPKGQPISYSDGIQGEELTLNAAGFPTDVTNLDEKGGRARDASGVLHYARTLDAHNRLAVGRRIGLFGTAITDYNGFFETRNVYDDQGRVIERSNHDASGNLLNNNDGVAIVRTIYTIYPDSTEIIESNFDASGQAVEEKSSGIHQRQRKIDARGLLLDEAYFDATGAPTLTLDSAIHERRYEYDARGNQISEEFLDTNGKPTNRKGPSFAKVIYKYDDKNRVSEKAYFGDDGAPQVLLSLGAAVIRQEYDSQGDLIHREFFDGQGHPSPHAQYGAPAIRIAVKGDTTSVTLRNERDQPTKNPINGYYAFSYKTATDAPLTIHNTYYDRHGNEMSLLRVRVINPHLHLLKTTPFMAWSAYLGPTGVGLGSLLASGVALRKSSHTKRRRVYVPTPKERFFGWLAIFAIVEGTLRFLITIYWTWIVYEGGVMGYGVYYLEAIIVIFFLYRLFRLTRTMRVLNIGGEDVHRLVREFFSRADLKPQWIERQRIYLTPPLDVRLKYFQQKFHAYLAFRKRGPEGAVLAEQLAAYLREHVRGIQAPVRTRAIAFYYSSVALSYFLLAGTAFYTLFQVIKGY